MTETPSARRRVDGAAPEGFLLATKTGERSRAAARDNIHRSLERLRVDHVDLLQLHSLAIRIEWEQALGPDGALEAAVEARAEGSCAPSG